MNKFDKAFNEALTKINVSTSLNFTNNLDKIYQTIKETKRNVKRTRK